MNAQTRGGGCSGAGELLAEGCVPQHDVTTPALLSLCVF